ncbi:hypothetical protein NLG97_g971 [Lecanicillium saksenae]|uniref:Uncharacterized protein n=1 Tax=Lecanicillium saksenae TaxID=468837 RepID=A0ACC1R962_9HYPO|nr:hypothetical protein NLG97_g971 [Lecanicillium saksenae]
MESFEAKLKEATTQEPLGLLGAIGLVVNKHGDVLYHHAAGKQRLDSAESLNLNSTVMLGSAGKFITHIAALQLVQRGAIDLDSPVWPHLPELEALPVLQGNGDTTTATAPITLRSLLLHTSGLSDPDSSLLKTFPEAVQKVEDAVVGAHPIVQHFSMPLAFEPGLGFAYGASIHWTQLLVTRLAGDQSFVQHIQENIFKPLDMEQSTYAPRDRNDIWENRLQTVERCDGRFVEADDASQGLYCSILDMGKILSDLISERPKLLELKYRNLLFEGSLSGASLADLRNDAENYAFCMGKHPRGEPPINWTMAGLKAEAELPLSKLPQGTVVWEGMPNVMWTMNKERGLASFFATQLLPIGDEKANDAAVEFMKCAWSTLYECDKQ